MMFINKRIINKIEKEKMDLKMRLDNLEFSNKNEVRGRHETEIRCYKETVRQLSQVQRWLREDRFFGIELMIKDFIGNKRKK